MKPGRARELAEKAAGEIYYDVDLMSNSHPRNVDVIESAIQAAVGEALDEAANNACCVRYPEIPCEKILELKKRWASK